MTKRINAFCSFTLLATLLLWTIPCSRLAQAQSTDGLVMVANKLNTSTNEITKDQARRIMMGEMTTWPNGMAIVVVLRPAGTPERTAVLKEVCGMTETIFTRNQMHAMFVGNPPATFHESSSQAAVKAAVHSAPGAVGFLHKSEVDASIKTILTLD